MFTGLSNNTPCYRGETLSSKLGRAWTGTVEKAEDRGVRGWASEGIGEGL